MLRQARRRPRPRRLVPSGVGEALEARDFEPTRATLDASRPHPRRRRTTASRSMPALRREALARYEALPAPGARPHRGWRYDYGALAFASCAGRPAASRSRRCPDASPRFPTDATAQDDVDRPALETETAGGIAFAGRAAHRRRFGRRPAHRRRAARPHARARRSRLRREAARDRRLARRQVRRARDGVRELRRVRARRRTACSSTRPCRSFSRARPATRRSSRISSSRWATARARRCSSGTWAAAIRSPAASSRSTPAEGAQLDYAVVQQAGEAARIFFSRNARCGRDAVVRWHLAELGGALARTVLGATLAEPGARSETSALFFNTGMQHVDLTSGAEHAVGPTTSDTVVRSAATDRGQGRYVGNIVIRPKAHGSDASLRDDALHPRQARAHRFDPGARDRGERRARVPRCDGRLARRRRAVLRGQPRHRARRRRCA